MYSTAIDLKKKPVFCTYTEPDSFYTIKQQKMQPECIPCDCEVILLNGIIIDNNGTILANKSETYNFALR